MRIPGRLGKDANPSPQFIYPAVIIIIFLWITSIYWVPQLTHVIIKSSRQCAKIIATDVNVTKIPQATGIDTCSEYMGMLGVTGDLFGAANALFSALALLAVAYALYGDIKARREDKKPLIIYTFDNNFIILDSPRFDDPKGINIKVQGQVKSLGEPALNISIHPTIRIAGDIAIDFGAKHILPLGQGDNSPLNFTKSLEAEHIGKSIIALGDSLDKLELHVEITFSSLQSVSWSTSSVYILQGLNGTEAKHLKALIGGDKVEYEKVWNDAQTISLWPQVKPNAWYFMLNQASSKKK